MFPFIICSILLTSFLLCLSQRLPRVFFNTGDTYVHSYLIRHHKKNKFSFKAQTSIEDCDFYYPALLYWFLGIFPESRWNLVCGLINLFVDYSIGIFLQLFGLLFLLDNGYSLVNSFFIAIFIGVVFFTSPLLLPAHVRMNGLASRPLGFWLAFLWSISLSQYLISSSMVYMFLVILVSYVMFLTSKFGSQFLWFTSFILLLLTLNPIPLGLTFLALVLNLFTPGYSLNSWLSYNISDKRQYLRNAQYMTTGPRNDLGLLVKSIKNFSKNPAELFIYLFKDNSFSILISGSPEFLILLIFGAIFLYNNHFGIIEYPTYYGLGIIFPIFLINISALITFVLTSFKPLSIFGEAERYIEFSYPLTLMMGIIAIPIIPNLIILLLVNLIIVSRSLDYFTKEAIKPSISQRFSEIITNKQTSNRSINYRVEGEKLLNNAFTSFEGKKLNVLCLEPKISFAVDPIEPDKYRFFHYYTSKSNNYDGMKWIKDAFPNQWTPRSQLSFYKNNYEVNVVLMEKRLLRLDAYKKIPQQLKLLGQTNSLVAFKI